MMNHFTKNSLFLATIGCISLGGCEPLPPPHVAYRSPPAVAPYAPSTPVYSEVVYAEPYPYYPYWGPYFYGGGRHHRHWR